MTSAIIVGAANVPAAANDNITDAPESASEGENFLSPVTDLHYAALPSHKPIDETHVHQLLGVGNHPGETVQKLLKKLKQCKNYVRGWAAKQIKSKMVALARILKSSAFTATLLVDGSPPTTFLDIKNWWRNPQVQQDEKNRNTMYYIAYGYWEECHDWENFLEKTFLEESGWSYCPESKAAVQGKNKRRGYEVKGCIAKNFTHVKHELVKQLQKAGRELNENCNFAKSRRGEMKNANKKKRRKKGDYYYKAYASSPTNNPAWVQVRLLYATSKVSNKH